MNKKEKKKTEKTSVNHKILTVIGTVLCIILIPVLAINIALIAQSYIHPDKVPSVGKVFPLIVLSDSMYPEIQGGDLIICNTIAADNVQVGDVIAFFDPAGNGTSIVTHRVTEIAEQDGSVAWHTQGDANNTEDAALVPADKLVGVYKTRIAGAGRVAMFMQTTKGLIICVILPIILLVGYDVIRRRKYEKTQKEDTAALMKELEELRSKVEDKDMER